MKPAPRKPLVSPIFSMRLRSPVEVEKLRRALHSIASHQNITLSDALVDAVHRVQKRFEKV